MTGPGKRTSKNPVSDAAMAPWLAVIAALVVLGALLFALRGTNEPEPVAANAPSEPARARVDPEKLAALRSEFEAVLERDTQNAPSVPNLSALIRALGPKAQVGDRPAVDALLEALSKTAPLGDSQLEGDTLPPEQRKLALAALLEADVPLDQPLSKVPESTKLGEWAAATLFHSSAPKESLDLEQRAVRLTALALFWAKLRGFDGGDDPAWKERSARADALLPIQLSDALDTLSLDQREILGFRGKGAGTPDERRQMRERYSAGLGLYQTRGSGYPLLRAILRSSSFLSSEELVAPTRSLKGDLLFRTELEHQLYQEVENPTPEFEWRRRMDLAESLEALGLAHLTSRGSTAPTDIYLELVHQTAADLIESWGDAPKTRLESLDAGLRVPLVSETIRGLRITDKLFQLGTPR
jgi:hypothetical protein